MALFTKKRFEELANVSSEYCISLYIPTERSGENKESNIKLKNQVQKIEQEMQEDQGMKSRQVEKYLGPVKELLSDNNLWRHLSDALIIFSNENSFYYTTLAVEIEEFYMISNRYYLLPLVSVFNNDQNFFILALSQHHNALYEANQNEIVQIITEDILPENIEKSVGKDVKQKSLQFRSGQTGQGTGIYHGKGEGKDDKKTEVRKYLTNLNNGLMDIMEGYHIPLIVAAVDNVFSMFKETSSYSNVYPEFVAGNPDHEDIILIHEKACDLLTPYFNKKRNEHKRKYLESKDLATSDLNEIIKASNSGSVETVFIKKGEVLWGEFNQDTNKVEIHNTKTSLDYCLLDFTARNTFLNGGSVFLEDQDDLPDTGSSANALLRFK